MEGNTPRKRKKRRKKHYLLKFLIFVALCVGLYFLLTSELFDVHKIEVSESSYFTSSQIIEKAGAKKGRNIFFETDAAEMKEKLLRDPYIRDADISRKLPATLKISVDERTEAAVVPYSATFIVIDGDGMVLKKTNTQPQLPLVEGLTIRKMNPGKPLEVEENAVLTDTLKLLNALQESDITFKKIDISNVIIKAYIYEQLVCQGSPEDILANIKNGNLEAVLYDLYKNGIQRGVVTVSGNDYCSFSPNV
ncbi:MAG: FtsQ-type POTRA domain-containing protein [Clostridia bacterium]|nr:FtsQ-type POTRA domain-containing protein [Clostridia bacterium]